MKRLVLQGFHPGAAAPYGLARLLISPSGRRKNILQVGERKNLKTDKVVLVRGKRNEVEMVRRIFFMCANEGKSCPQIADELNAKGLTYRRRRWTCDRIFQILHRSEYIGLNVWARREQRLYAPSRLRPKSQWVVSKAPFKGIVDQEMYVRAQRVLASRHFRHDPDILIKKLKGLLSQKGRLSYRIIENSRKVPCVSVYVRHFGSLHRAYEMVGFDPSRDRCQSAAHHCLVNRLHNAILNEIHDLFPLEVSIRSLGKWHRPFLEVDKAVRVSILVCGKHSRQLREDETAWLLRTSPWDRQRVVLLCLLDEDWENVVQYRVLPPLGDSVMKHHTIYKDDLLLTKVGETLKGLNQFCSLVRRALASASESHS